MLDQQSQQSMKQAGIMVLGLVFVLWCWRSTRNAEEGHKHKKRPRSPTPKTTPEGTQMLDEDTPLTDPNAASSTNTNDPNANTNSGSATPQRASTPTPGAAASGPPSPINDEIRFTAQMSTDGTRVLKLESRSLADQGDSPSTRAFYEILGRYSDIVSEEGSSSEPPPTPAVQAPTEAILKKSKASSKAAKSKKKSLSKKKPKAKKAVAGYGTAHTSSSENEHEDEDDEGEESDSFGRTASLPPPRSMRSNSKKYLGGARLSSSDTRHARHPNEHSRRRFEDRHSHSHSHHSQPHRHSYSHSTANNYSHSHSHSSAASVGSLPPISPALRSANFPRRISTAPPNYYNQSGASASGYRSEGNVGSSLHSRSAHFRTSSTSSGPTRQRSTSLSRSPNSLPALARRHRAKSLLSHANSAGASNASSKTPLSPYESPRHGNSNSASKQSSLSPPEGQASHTKSPGDSSGYADAPTHDGGLETEREWDTDSLSTTFSLADSFENDSTASNRVFATANVAAFSESDSYYRDEVVSLKRVSHTERIHRLKKLRESSQIPLSLTARDHAQKASPPVVAVETREPMVFGPYSNESQSQAFFNPPASVAGQALSDVEEGDESGADASVARSSPRLLTATL